MLPLILFCVFAAIVVAAAVGVIVSRNPVYAALYLVLCFVASAGIWLLIEAEFLALVLVLVYVGAVMVLFLFVVMMLDIDLEQLRSGFTRYAWLGWIIAALVVVEMAGAVVTRKLGIDVLRSATPHPAGYSNTTQLGELLYSRYVYPFEIAAMLLLVAIVTAIALTLRRRQGLKMQDVARQVAARPSERVRIVQMDSEERK
ncbi:MAG: NADH-quinone oxidoreductase subunit J [Steroidobacteraceae bacterium]